VGYRYTGFVALPTNASRIYLQPGISMSFERNPSFRPCAPHKTVIKIKVFVRDGKLFLQAAGQPELGLKPVSAKQFEFAPAGIVVSSIPLRVLR
jgi:hypothetical protein